MEILENITAAVNNTLKIANVEGKVTVTTSFFDVDVNTEEDANKLKSAFSKSFDEVEIFSLEEIGEEGFTVTVRI